MDFWELRIGIHTGPLIAGVIGAKKFTYDVWSDTVNIASRCESSGEVNKINISGTTYNLVNDFFLCEYRGHVPVKNKKDMEMAVLPMTCFLNITINCNILFYQAAFAILGFGR